MDELRVKEMTPEELTAAVAQAVQQETEDIKGKNLPDGSGDDFRELPPLSCPGV